MHRSQMVVSNSIPILLQLVESGKLADSIRIDGRQLVFRKSPLGGK